MLIVPPEGLHGQAHYHCFFKYLPYKHVPTYLYGHFKLNLTLIFIELNAPTCLKCRSRRHCIKKQILRFEMDYVFRSVQIG